MPKAITPAAAARQARRHNPLEDDLTATGPLRTKPSKRKSKHEDQDEEKFVDSKASRKILKIGQELAEEDQEDVQVTQPNTAFNFESRFGDDDNADDQYDNEEAWGEEEEEVEEIELAPGDLETFSKFFPTQEDPLLQHGWGGAADESEQAQGGTNLADLILEKIAQHEAMQARQGGSGADTGPGPIDEEYELPPKVVEVYTKYVRS
jgi:essential nuclear protein 1